MGDVTQEELDLLTAPLLFGYLFSFMLFGMLIVQVYDYYQTFPTDSRWIKAFVGSIFIVELALTIGTCSTAWHVLGSEYGEIRSIVQMDTGSLTLQGLTAFSSLLAHCFYVWRIWRLTRSKIMPTIITTVSVAQFFIATFINIYYAKSHRDFHALQQIKLVVLLWGIFTGSADILITLTLLVIMWKARHQAIAKDTRATINRVMNFTAQTGLILSLSVVIYLVMLYTMSDTYLATCFYYLIGHLYGVTAMASLNARSSPRASNLRDNVEFDDNNNEADIPIDPFWQDVHSDAARQDESHTSSHAKSSVLDMKFVAAPNEDLREEDNGIEDVELELQRSRMTVSSSESSTLRSSYKRSVSAQIQTDE